jgi:hypothetical protein
MGGLSSSVAWFVVGALLLGGAVVVSGAAPSGWSVELVVGPLVIGWVGLALLASVTHLVPAVGPGDQAAHRRQRERLGLAGRTRIVVLDAGIALVSLGPPTGIAWLVASGAVLVGAATAVTIALVFLSLLRDLRSGSG